MTGALNARSVAVTDAWGYYKGWQLLSSVYSGSTEEADAPTEDMSNSGAANVEGQDSNDKSGKSQDTSESFDSSGENRDTGDGNVDTGGHGQDTGEEGLDTSGDEPQNTTEAGVATSCGDSISMPNTIDPRRDQVR